MHWMEILKDTRYPDIRLITKSETIPLPANDDEKWNKHLNIESKTNEFIQSIKDGNYQNKGISATISILEKWRDEEDSFRFSPRVRDIYSLGGPSNPNTKEMVKSRIDRIINEVLPILKDKIKEINQERGKGKATISSKTTKEDLVGILDGFDSKKEKEKEDILFTLNSLSKNKRAEFTPLLTQNYPNIRVYLREANHPAFTVKTSDLVNFQDSKVESTYDKIRRYYVTTEVDLSSHNFNRTEKGRWFKDFTDTKGEVIREYIKSISNKPKSENKPLPIWEMFGEISEEQEVTLTKENWSISGQINNVKARDYFSIVKEVTKSLNEIFRPKKMLNFNKREWRNTRPIMVELLSPDFNIEETMVENFIEGMKSRSTFSRNALRNFIALQIWEASINPEAARRNPKLRLQLVPGQRSNAGVSPNQYSKYKDKILSSLNGEKREVYNNELREHQEISNVNAEMSRSISAAELEMIESLATEKDEALDVLDNPEIDDLVDNLNFESLNFKEVSKDGVTYFHIPKGNPVKIINDLFREGANDDNFKGLYDKISQRAKQDEKSTDIDLSGLSEKYDFSSMMNLEKFSGLEKYIAEIIYTSLLSNNPKSLHDIVMQTTNYKPAEGSLDFLEVVAGIKLLGNRYSHTKANQMDTLSEQIKPLDDVSEIKSETPPYVEEIKKFTETLKGIIPEIRSGLILGVQERIEDIIEHPHKYQKKKEDILSTLEKRGLIQVVKE